MRNSLDQAIKAFNKELKQNTKEEMQKFSKKFYYFYKTGKLMNKRSERGQKEIKKFANYNCVKYDKHKYDENKYKENKNENYKYNEAEYSLNQTKNKLDMTLKGQLKRMPKRWRLNILCKAVKLLKQNLRKGQDPKLLYKNFLHKYIKPTTPYCFCCNNKSEVMHHIVHLKNNGTNNENNLVPLCLICKNKIYPNND